MSEHSLHGNESSIDSTPIVVHKVDANAKKLRRNSISMPALNDACLEALHRVHTEMEFKIKRVVST